MNQERESLPQIKGAKYVRKIGEKIEFGFCNARRSSRQKRASEKRKKMER